MKTKEFIKMLQESDPTGEAYIRMDGGVPFAAEPKPGYYDGPYSYIDENDNWVVSARNTKIDIACMDLREWAYLQGEWGKSWEEVQEKIKFEFEIYRTDGAKDREEKTMEKARKGYEEYLEMDRIFKEKYSKPK